MSTQHVEEQDNILEMVQRSPSISMQRLSTHLIVSQTHVWGTLRDDDLYPFHPQCVKNLHQRDSAMHLEFCHWSYTNHVTHICGLMMIHLSLCGSV
jgi:hypothetical protein